MAKSITHAPGQPHSRLALAVNQPRRPLLFRLSPGGAGDGGDAGVCEKVGLGKSRNTLIEWFESIPIKGYCQLYHMKV